MTAYPIEDNAGHWWLTTRKKADRLHAIPGRDVTGENLRDAIDWIAPLIRRAACGAMLDLTYPGMSSRFGLPRCAHCCRALGIPAGNGTPCNENDSRQPAQK